LAKKAGLKPSTISKARSGTQPMKWDALVAIARAIDVRPELVLRIAGFLPPEPGKSTEMEEWDSIFDRLSDEDRAELLEMAHFKAARRGWPWHRR
jgi:transcriptional regulator with XRE-family HTH domain